MTNTAYRKPKMNRVQQNNYLGDKLKKKYGGRVSSAAEKSVPKSNVPDAKVVRKARERINPFDSSVKPDVRNSPPNYAKANTYIQTKSGNKQNYKSISAASAQTRAKVYNMSGAAAVNAGVRNGQIGRTRSDSISADRAGGRAEARRKAH